MKRILSLCLAIAMMLFLVGCGCDHASAALRLSAVDTALLTMEQELYCGDCDKVLETQSTPTGIAPVDGVLLMSPEEWFGCLTTVIRTYETTGTLIPIAAESQDDALLYSVLTLSGFKSVIAFYDSQGNVLTTGQAAERGKIHEIRVEAQFDNATAESFYTLLLLMGINNNSGWDNESINLLCQQIMDQQTVTDNGYTYSMQILSVEDHTVAVSIIAE